eukprot:TRINITY_DN17071_c0_g1_i1.p1 TRINITY_DN17071_c0_g1~~TRINITY_DN17071_c0_g1_i1.p1  ORF type:complete len:287 (+),score=85.83 TRINITY_DN17071_c0_g1_i1:46-906(+)
MGVPPGAVFSVLALAMGGCRGDAVDGATAQCPEAGMARMHRAFVVGATGATGRSVVAQLAGRGWDVTAVVRREAEKTALFPDLKQADRVALLLAPDVEEWSRQETALGAFKGASAVFLCSGTSRQNAEVKKAMEERGADGFTEWLTRIDVELSKRVAAGAYAQGVPVVARISATNADPAMDPAALNGFGNYFKHQGIADRELANHPAVAGETASLLLFRPGALYRGEDLRALRPWEQTDRHANGLDVAHLARAMIAGVEEQLALGAPALRIFEKTDIDAVVAKTKL